MSETIIIDLVSKTTETAAEIFEGVELPEMNLANLQAELQELITIEGDKKRNVYREGQVPVTLNFLRQYTIDFPEKYVYNAELATGIKKKTDVPVELHKALDTAVYLAQHEQDKLIKKLRVSRFLAAGFLDADDFSCKQGTKVIAMIQNPNASSCAFSTQEGTLREIPGQGWWLMPPKSRNKGFPLAHREMYVKQIGRFSK